MVAGNLALRKHLPVSSVNHRIQPIQIPNENHDRRCWNLFRIWKKNRTFIIICTWVMLDKNLLQNDCIWCGECGWHFIAIFVRSNDRISRIALFNYQMIELTWIRHWRVQMFHIETGEFHIQFIAGHRDDFPFAPRIMWIKCWVIWRLNDATHVMNFTPAIFGQRNWTNNKY